MRLSISSSIISRLMSFILGIWVFRFISINYSDNDISLWVIFSSIYAFIGFADFGISNALIAKTSDLFIRARRKDLSRYISTAVVSLIFISLICFVLYIIINMIFDIPKWLNIQKYENSSILLNYILIVFLINIPLGFISRVQVGLQIGYLNSYYQILSNILLILGIYLITLNHSNFKDFVIIYYIFPNLVLLFNIFIFINGPFGKLIKLSLKNFNLGDCKLIIGKGLCFFGIQLTAGLISFVDPILINKGLDSSQVTLYGVTDKLFSVITLSLGVFLAPLWAAYLHAKHNNDKAWIKKIFKQSLILSIFWTITIGLLIFVYNKEIIQLWLSKDIEITGNLVLAFIFLKLCESVAMCFGALYNGMDFIGFQLKIAVLTCIFLLPIKVLMIEKYGVVGAILSTAFCMLFFAILPSFVRLIRFLKSE